MVKMLLKTFGKHRVIFLAAAFLLAFTLLTLINLEFVKGNPGGDDFHTYWFGTRNFLLDGRSPYGAENRLELQNMVYGRAALEGEEQFFFSIPLFGMLIYGPFALISDFLTARALWMTCLEFSLLAIIYLSIKLAWWKINRTILIPLLIFTFFSFHGLSALLDGRLIIPTTLLALGVLTVLRNKQDELAGLMLAFIFISPVPLILFVIFLLLRLIINKRMKVVWWMLGSTGLLIGFSVVLIPNWTLQYIVTLINSYQSIIPASPGSVLIDRWGDIGTRISIVISVLIGLLIIIEWFKGLKADEPRALWTVMVTLALTTWSGIRISPLDYIFLLPAIIFGFELFQKRWKKRASGIILSILAFLFVIDWIIFFSIISIDLKSGISSFLLIPMPVTTIIILYWTKWWVQKSRSIELEPTKLEIHRP